MSVQLLPICPIDNAIEAICSDRQSINKNKKIAKAIFLSIGLVVSVTAKYFFYPVAHEGGTSIFGNNSVGDGFGIVFEFFYSKAFVTLEMWALNGILDAVLSNKSQEELAARQKISTLGKVALGILTVAAAVFARYPFALPAAQYNKSAPIAALIFSLAAGIVLPIRSIQLTIGQLSSFKNCNCLSPVASAKRKFVEYLEKVEGALLTKNLQELSAVQKEINLIDPNSKSTMCLSKYFAYGNISNKLENALKKISIGVTIPLTAILEYAIADYTFYTTKNLVLNNVPFAATLAATSVLVTFYFYGKAIYESSYRFFRFVTNKCNNAPSLPLAEKIFPRLINSLKTEEFFSNLLALGPWYAVWGNFYSTPPAKHWFFVTTLLLTLFATLQAASSAVIENGALLFVQNEEGRKAIKLISNLRRIKETISAASDAEFLTFFSQLPAKLKDQILTEAELEVLEETITLLA